MVDHAATWVELQAWIAEEPNRGRGQILQKMAELAKQHTIPEDELERAMRLVSPRIMDLLLNRMPELAQLVASMQDPQDQVGEESAPSTGSPETVRPSMAAV